MTNTTRIKLAIGYLRTLTEEQIKSEWDTYAIEKTLTMMGAIRIGSGCFSTCYALDGFVIKISSQDLGKLREWRNHKVFKRFVPTVYWMHQCGKALVCKLVKFVRPDYGSARLAIHRMIRRRLERLFRQAGFAAEDMHSSNLVRVEGTRRWLVIDYGCLTGN